MAINRTWRTESGEQQEEVTYVDVDVFGRQAEVIGQFLKKGRPILVEGRLKLDQWADKQTGQKRSKLGVVLESFQFVDSGRGSAGEEQAGSRRSGEQPPTGEPGGAGDRDDVPF